MAITRTIIFDGPDRTDWRDDDPTIGYVGWGTDWKSGSGPFNAQQQQDKMRQALAQLESNYTNWATLTNAQKDTANRLAQRVASALIRQQLQQLDTPGV